jgi:hypothetical protein
MACIACSYLGLESPAPSEKKLAVPARKKPGAERK